MTDKERAIKVLRLTCAAILDAAERGGTLGAPSGVIYAAMSQYGMNLPMYQQIIAALVDAGRIRVQNNCIVLA